MASYLYSKLEGNFDGALRAVHQRRRRPEHLGGLRLLRLLHRRRATSTRITNKGPLSNDRRHQFKVSGFYLTPLKLSIGGSAYYRTGTPLTRYGFSDGYGRYEFFLAERGAKAVHRRSTRPTSTSATRSRPAR